MIDKKGKLFGKINIVDLLFVLLLVAVACVTVYKFGFSTHKNINQTDTKIQYVLKVPGVRGFTADSINVGDEIYDDESDKCIGVVEEVEKKQAMDHIAKQDGTIVYTEKPERYDVYVTVESDARIINGGYFANGAKEIGVFSDIIIYSQDFTCQTEVVSVGEKIEK